MTTASRTSRLLRRFLTGVNRRELAFDLLVLLAVEVLWKYAQPTLEALAGALHGLGFWSALAVSFALQCAFFPAMLSPMVARDGVEAVDSWGEKWKPLQSLSWVGMLLVITGGALFAFFGPSLILEAISARPPTGGAVLGLALGMFVAAILLDAVVLSALTHFEVPINTGLQIYFMLILPVCIGMSLLLLDQMVLGLVLLGIFRAGYLLWGVTGLANLALLGLTIYALLT